MIKLVALFLVLWAALPGTASAAVFHASPVPTEGGAVSLDFTLNQVRYEVPTSRLYISRDTIAASWLYESFFVSLGYINHSDFDFDVAKLEPLPLAGESGHLFAFGARGAIWRAGDFSVNAHAQAQGLNEETIVDGVRYKLKSQEILAGLSAVWQPPGWRVYSGCEGIPYSHIETAAPGLEEIQRSDFFIVHVGGGVDLGPFFVSTDFQFVGAEGVRFSVGYEF